MKPFVPEKLPLENISFSDLMPLIGRANRSVARYDGLLKKLVNPELLLSPLRTKEAVLSSKIEGTRTTFEDIATFDAKGKTDREMADLEEVLNYRKALSMARDQLGSYPLTLNVIRRVHEVLMNGVRGKNSAKGEFRKIQNWIGPVGSTLETASHVPPAVPVMMEALYNFENYLHSDDVDIMVQLAIVHAQFEIIHPFLDGNGRLGRILIPLFLYHKEVIHEPFFYLSDYLESNRAEYYQRLKAITQDSGWHEWVAFFLRGIIAQSEKTIEQTENSIELYERMKEEFVNITNSTHAIRTLDFVFKNPIFSNLIFEELSGIPARSSRRILKRLTEERVIDVIKKGATNIPTLYEFRPLLRIINR